MEAMPNLTNRLAELEWIGYIVLPTVFPDEAIAAMILISIARCVVRLGDIEAENARRRPRGARWSGTRWSLSSP